MKSLKKKHEHHIERWLNKGKIIDVNYPDITADILQKIVDTHVFAKHNYTVPR